MIKVAVLTNIIPPYRRDFYDRLFNRTDISLDIYCQEKLDGFNIQSIHEEFPLNINTIKHISFIGGSISWQFMPWMKLIKNYDVIFVDSNPRILNHALFATIMSFFSKKIVLWSMVHSFRNNKIAKIIRLSWMKIFKFHFLYNDGEVALLNAKHGFSGKILLAMNNGLNQEYIEKLKANWNNEKLKQFKLSNNINSDNILISSGRVTEGKFEIVLETLASLKHQFQDILYIIIGGGDYLPALKKMAIDKGLGSNTLFIGESYDEEKLCPYFLISKLFVHPTAVGLSINHAFGYGLPIVTHDQFENHGPEIVAFEEGVTGLLYNQDDIEDLSLKLSTVLKSPYLIEMGLNALSLVKSSYNTSVMSDRFAEITRRRFINK